MLGVHLLGAPYLGQAFSLEGEIVLVVSGPDLLELVGVSMGPIALVASADGALRLVALDAPTSTMQGVD